jgi:tRNA G18 (ribose-2'-O)-methylase SpoU
MAHPTPSVILILDNIRSAQNVGAIFRTADAAGVDKIYLVGITPAPRDRFGRVQPQIAKTALGAAEVVAWESCTDHEAVVLVEELTQRGVAVVAVEQLPDATDLYDFQVPPTAAYIFGNEVTGVSSGLAARATHALSIPMRGTKESLNVAVSVGIVLYHRS